MERPPLLPETVPATPRASALVSVSRVTPADSPPGIAGFDITYPEPGSCETVYSLPLEGWVVPALAAPEAIRVEAGHSPLAHAPVAIVRPDVGRLHPDLSWAGRAGFAIRLNALELPSRFRLALSVLIEGGGQAELGTVEGERRPLPIQDMRYQPLIVTTIGRSGSTWLTWLLGRQPEIVDYRSFEYESKVAPYFAEVLRTLTRPLSYYQPIRGEIDQRGWWLGHEPSEALFWYSSHDSIDEWLGSEYVEDLIDFFTGRLDALFGRLAHATGKEDARYVIEKMPPSYFGQRMMAEMIPGSRELFVVRDFRDVAASIFAFGEKRGRRWFSGYPSESDEQIVREPLRNEIDRLLQSWRERRDSAFLVRYEDLVLRPEETLSGVLSYLELDTPPADVTGALADAARIDGNMHGAHITSPTAMGSVGRWQRDLTPDLQRACEEALGEGLEAFGYV
jgi:sulfotransferase family protein